MTFPTVEGFQQTLDQVDTVTPVFDLPAGVQEGDHLLVAVAGYDGGGVTTYTAEAGWTKIDEGNWSNTITYALFHKISDGTETTCEPTPSRAAVYAAHAYVIRGAAEYEIATVVEQAGNASVDSVTPPPITASWGGGDNLFFAVAVCGRTGDLFTGTPAGYTSQAHVSDPDAQSYMVSIGSGYKAAASDSDAPGDFVSDTYQSFVSNTLVFRSYGATFTLSSTDIFPNSSVSGTGTNYGGMPSVLTMFDGSGNTFSSSGLSFTGSGQSFSFDTTTPSKPAEGESAAWIKYGAITINIPDPGE